MSTSLGSPETRTPSEPPGKPPTSLGVVIAVLSFAIVFAVVTRWAGLDTATVVAILAAIPGILLAAYGRRR